MTERDMLPKVAAGWHLCLVVAEHLLDGDPIPPIRGEAAKEFGWDELSKTYAEELGARPRTRRWTAPRRPGEPHPRWRPRKGLASRP